MVKCNLVIHCPTLRKHFTEFAGSLRCLVMYGHQMLRTLLS